MAFEGSSRVLLVIRETAKKDDPGQGWGMWVIQYLDVNNHSISVKVVCGSFTTDPGSGEKRYYAKGMGLRDFDTLRPKWREAEAIMKSPPSVEGEISHEDSPFG